MDDSNTSTPPTFDDSELDIEKQSLSMEGFPTLWDVSVLGTKKLTRQRGDFLTYLIGLVEQREGEHGFCAVESK